MTTGNTTTATGPDPTQVFEFRYRVIPLAQLIASHDATLAVNPDFPSVLQPRIRGREASRLQVRKIANNLQPDALLEDLGTLDRGPMIVGPDNVVESGNGRTIALKLAHLEFPRQFEAYQDRLRDILPQYGIDPSEIRSQDAPVLVRERISDVDRVQFAAQANQATTLTMSPLEQALQDSKSISDEAMASLTVGPNQSIDQALQSKANRTLVTRFQKSIPDNEQAALVGPGGELNMVGLQRLKAAVFAKVFPGESGGRLTQVFFESLDPVVKTVENAVFDALPALAKAEGLTRSGQRTRDLAIGEDLAKAVDVLARLKGEGMAVEDFLAQDSFFERELDPEQEKLLAFLDEQGRGRRRIRETLAGYAAAVIASPHPQQGALFGAATVETKGAILDRLFEAQRKEAQGGQVGLFGLIESRERAEAFSAGVPREPTAAAPAPRKDGPQLEGPGGRGSREGEARDRDDSPGEGEARDRVAGSNELSRDPVAKSRDPLPSRVEAKNAAELIAVVESHMRPGGGLTRGLQAYDEALKGVSDAELEKVLTWATSSDRNDWIQRFFAGHVRGEQRARERRRQRATDTAEPVATKTNGAVPEGRITRAQAIARLMDVDQGSRRGRRRNPTVDSGVQAGAVAPENPTDDKGRKLQERWWNHPNELDYEGVDTPATPKSAKVPSQRDLDRESRRAGR